MNVQVHFDMWEVKSGEVISFAQEMGSRLQVLKLNAMYHWFTVEAAEAIADHCTSLQELAISGPKYGKTYSFGFNCLWVQLKSEEKTPNEVGR